MSDPREPTETVEEELADERDDEAEAGEEREVGDTDAGDDDAEPRDEGDDARDREAEDAGGDDGAAEAGRAPAEVREPRRETRYQRLANERREARERAERLERELQDLRQRVDRPQQPRETPEQKAARRALMDPEERHQEELNELRQDFGGQLTAIQRQMLDSNDRSAYERFADRHQLSDAIRDKVTLEYDKAVREGRFIPRDALAKYFLGEAVLQRSLKNGKQQRERGQRRIERETARPTGGRSDVVAERRPRGDSAEARRKRLENQEI